MLQYIAFKKYCENAFSQLANVFLDVVYVCVGGGRGSHACEYIEVCVEDSNSKREREGD